MSSPFHDSSDYLIFAYTNQDRQLVCDGKFYEWDWDGDGRNLTSDDIDNFGLKEWDIEFSEVARQIDKKWEDTPDEDEDEDGDEGAGEIITKVTVFEIKKLYKKGELCADESSVIGFRVAKSLSYFRPFIVD